MRRRVSVCPQCKRYQDERREILRALPWVQHWFRTPPTCVQCAPTESEPS